MARAKAKTKASNRTEATQSVVIEKRRSNGSSNKVIEDTGVAIIGSGFGGIGLAIRLRLAGINRFRIYEQTDDIGGTWRDNRYPGAACDVPSHLYSFSFEPNPSWSRMFAPQQEIFAYLQACVEKYGLRSRTQFNTCITSAKWHEADRRWHLQTADGREIRARAMVLATGALNRPAYPEIPGLSEFQGKLMHTAQWDGEFDLRSKRVAVIGTGASAIQVIPALAPQVAQLTVFQRTPAWVLPKPDRLIKARERLTYRYLPAAQCLYRGLIYALGEAATPLMLWPQRCSGVAERVARRFIASQVSDPKLRDRLTPDYRIGCKRILLSNDYYPALQRDNVEVVSTGIREVRADATIDRSGKSHSVDAIVLATGFQVPVAAAPFPIEGLPGRDLNQDWAEGAEAYKGVTISGYPNLLMIMGPNTGPGNNSVIFYIESQIRYILQYLQALQGDPARALNLKAPLQRRFNERLQQRMQGTAWTSGCHSWYLTANGKNTSLWPGFSLEFFLKTRVFRREDYVATPGWADRPVSSLLLQPA